MAVGLIVGAIALAGGLYLASLIRRPDVQQSDMAPNTLDSFKLTMAEEGSVVPLVFGTARLSSNILWYGDLITKEVTESVDTGGKGSDGGSQDVTVGYDYWLSLWYGICIGPVAALVGTYNNDAYNPGGLAGAESSTFNLGYEDEYPTEVGEYSSKINPVCHMFLKNFYLGRNVSTVPTIHWVVTRNAISALSNGFDSDGSNPAAVIYNLLTMAGVPSNLIETTSFQDACNYWNLEYCNINIVFSKQIELRKAINRVFTYVDGNIRQDSLGRFELKPWRRDDTYDVEIVDKTEFKKFTFTRKTWDDCYTDFRANYIDKDQHYTKRTVRVINTAVQQIIGYSRQITIDLTAFIDVGYASKRLWELARKMSYPIASVSCIVSLKYSSYREGDIVRINHADYGISDMDFRIIKVELGGADSNEINWELEQFIESIFDANYSTAGGTSWTTPDNSPVAPYDADVFELPYTTTYGLKPAFLLLIARKGAETGYSAIYSIDGVDYSSGGSFGTFSQHGSLDEEYTQNTYSIDDEIGILYTPDREDPEFDTVSRGSLFETNRIAIIGMSEIVAFQTVTPVGTNQIRLTGVIRGLLNTPISTHTIGTEIWITRDGDNVLTGISLSSFKVKLLPYFGSETLDASEVSAIDVTLQNKGTTPWPVSSIEVTRVDDVNTVVIIPTVMDTAKGAGVYAAEAMQLTDPVPFEGQFLWWTSIDPTVRTETDTTWEINSSGSFILYVKQKYLGFESDTRQVTVTNQDGIYYCSTNQVSNTGLEKIPWGTSGWDRIMSRNANRLNDTVLKISSLVDVDDSGRYNTTGLVYNATSGKFESDTWSNVYLTSTSTSTVTSTTSTT
jgi:hypothetical protein